MINNFRPEISGGRRLPALTYLTSGLLSPRPEGKDTHGSQTGLMKADALGCGRAQGCVLWSITTVQGHFSLKQEKNLT